MELKPEIQLKQQQKLVMTPQLQQAIRMLQLSNIEMSQRIEEELVENPALEIEERADNNEYNEDELSGRLNERDGAGQDDFDEEYFYVERSLPRSVSGDQEDRKREFLEGAVSRQETLHEYLTRQIHLLNVLPEDLRIAEIIISCINDDGYLNAPVEEIGRDFGIDPLKVESVLKIVQSLDPPGVGARNIQECLLIQLRDRGHHPVAERIITDFLQEVKLRKHEEIARRLGVSLEELKENLGLIAGLEPYPGRQFYTDTIRYIVPDVIVVEGEDGFQVLPNNTYIPRLRVNGYFEELLRVRNGDKKLRDFLADKVQRARGFINSVQQRESTLVRVTQAILERQFDFFRYGPMHLKPMTLRDVAAMVDLHESTVSRITSSKYVQTGWGVFRLKYFFSGSVPARGRADLSSTSIKEMIKEIIKQESGRNHLSDQKIADMLAERGIRIARRTVAKYRKELHILPSNLRRS